MKAQFVIIILFWTISENSARVFVDFEDKTLGQLSTKCDKNSRISHSILPISQLRVPFPKNGTFAFISSNGFSCLESNILDLNNDFIFKMEYLYLGNRSTVDRMEVSLEDQQGFFKKFSIVPSNGKWKTFQKYFRNANREIKLKVTQIILHSINLLFLLPKF